MKIVFVIPGTKIKLLEDTTTSVPVSYRYDTTVDKYCLQKGDELKVSQVYIRKNGWFASSLTFKPVGGPIIDRISKNKINSDLEANKKLLLEEEANIGKLNALGEDIEWFVK